jgi:hypothetical protein
MQRILINDASQLELLKSHDRIEVCDKEGFVIGVFVSLGRQDPDLLQWAKSQISDEELERRKSQRGAGRTTAEVIGRLAAQ